MKKLILLTFLCFASVGQSQNDVFYHVFQRSFFDSDGDKQGDLKGIHQKLDYLQELGVTTLLLTPLYASDFYHNYFAYDFAAIDPEYGTMDDYLLLVKEVHKRKMKIYQDVEMQYVAGGHPWYKEGYGKPGSRYGDYLVYLDEAKTKPFLFWNIDDFTMWDGQKQKILVVNMANPEVKDYTYRTLLHWVDPNGDGRFDDGVDGFRLDHMMDDLDNAGKLTHLFRDFWTPLLGKLRGTNPKLKIVAEQADWASYGHEYMTGGSVDYTFAFRLKFALTKFDKREILKTADSTFHFNSAGKNQLVFLENHDTGRYASEPGMTVAKSKAAVALQLLIGGIPSIYYGQEIGMKGKQQSYGTTDGNDIGVREAFDWYIDGQGKGMARWYEKSGPWWDTRNEKPADGISLEEQQNDPNSLFSWYRTLLALRAETPALQQGVFSEVRNDNEAVVSFYREYKGKKVLVVVNLSDKAQVVTLEGAWLVGKNLLHKGYFFKRSARVDLAPYEVIVAKP